MADPELQLVEQRVRSFPDFPTPGVVFRCKHRPPSWRPDLRAYGWERVARDLGTVGQAGRAGREPSSFAPGAAALLRPRRHQACPWVQGHLARPEGPRLLPRRHRPPGATPEGDPRGPHRLHRRLSWRSRKTPWSQDRGWSSWMICWPLVEP
ncbi:adenine phosphoribosyltransferase isoform X2 [Nomascus leucogenys]|uniref:adenine phosphoribosyltransferase isoform X2 n=1 Tax=Nomascus leucogenys TaxID=61853 RepID=UPI00122D5EE2|nr:adenine phosphoribosyltransferase isoform X2 [Nomascus leucogenys]